MIQICITVLDSFREDEMKVWELVAIVVGICLLLGLTRDTLDQLVQLVPLVNG